MTTKSVMMYPSKELLGWMLKLKSEIIGKIAEAVQSIAMYERMHHPLSERDSIRLRECQYQMAVYSAILEVIVAFPTDLDPDGDYRMKVPSAAVLAKRMDKAISPIAQSLRTRMMDIEIRLNDKSIPRKERRELKELLSRLEFGKQVLIEVDTAEMEAIGSIIGCVIPRDNGFCFEPNPDKGESMWEEWIRNLGKP